MGEPQFMPEPDIADVDNPTAAEVNAAIKHLADRHDADPANVHALTLTYGGEIALSEHDGDYQLRIGVDSGQFSIRVSALDVWEFRQMTNRVVAGRLDELSQVSL